MSLFSRSPWFKLLAQALCAAALLAAAQPLLQQLGAQTPADTAGPSAAPAPTGTEAAAEPAPAAPAAPKAKGLSVLNMYLQGGFFMLPITALSILAVTMTIERGIAIRRSRIIPQELVAAIGQLGSSPGGFDPRKAYRLCQQFPSSASRVVRAMLLKVGRPLSEVEHSIGEASEREAERLYFNVRWIELAAKIAPLIGLIGTIQGMIIAFHQFANLPPGQNQASVLAEGIYVALVTTFAGLMVAIPSVTAAHYFEGKITTYFHEVDELLFNLLPQVERYEGRVRFSRAPGEEGADLAGEATGPAPAAAAPAAAR